MYRLDADGRRHRYARAREPVVDRIDLQEADYLWFEYLNRHGYLTSLLLHRATEHLRPSKQRVQRRLLELTTGEKDMPVNYLYRPPGQELGHKAKSQHLAYGNDRRAEAALGDRRCAVRPIYSASFPHQLMQSTAAFSLDFCAKPRGFRYVTRSEVLTSDKCGEAKGSKRPMAIPLPAGGRLTPDDIFALENKERRRRYLILEVDRNTESWDPRGENRNLLGEKTTYFLEKLLNYERLFAAGTIKTWWGFNRPLILILTTDRRREERVLECASKMDPKIGRRFLVKCDPAFGEMWTTDSDVLEHLYDEPWQTIDGPVMLTQI